MAVDDASAPPTRQASDTSAEDRDTLSTWALEYPAYVRLAGGLEELAALLEPARRDLRASGVVPGWCGVDLLRGWAFLLHRLAELGGGALGAEWDAVLDALARYRGTPGSTTGRPGAAVTAAPRPRGDVGTPVLGVDACPAGWVGVRLDGAAVTVVVAATIGELVAAADEPGRVVVVGIDIPIGLPDSGERAADRLARGRIGPRAPSVFATATRAALTSATHAEAVVANRELTGRGLSAQAYALRTKILQADAWVRTAGRPVIEVHPEVSFAALHGGHLVTKKSTPEGIVQRRAALEAQGIVLDGPLRRPRVGEDDVLDAAAAAWTARRHARGEAMSLPDPPEVFADGWPAAIWV